MEQLAGYAPGLMALALAAGIHAYVWVAKRKQRAGHPGEVSLPVGLTRGRSESDPFGAALSPNLFERMSTEARPRATYGTVILQVNPLGPTKNESEKQG
jgi:hypothetical protein